MSNKPGLAAGLAAILIARPRLNLLLLAFALLAAGIATRSLRFDPSTEKLFPEKHPALQSFRDFRATFGSDEFIVLAYAAPNSILTRPELHRLQQLTAKLAELDQVDAVRSLTQLPKIEASPLSPLPKLSPLFPKDPRTMSEDELQQAAEKLRKLPYVKPLLLSKDERATAIVIEVKRQQTNQYNEDQLFQLVDEVRDIVRSQLSQQNIEAHLAGSPVIKVAILEAIVQDLATFLLPLLVLAALASFCVFKTLRGVLIPIAIIAATDLLLLGVLAAAGYRLSTMTALLPPLMFVVAIADSIHVLVEIESHRASHPQLSAKQSLEQALTAVIPPCCMTTLTTGIGFASLLFSDIRPVREFGGGAAVGTLLAFLVTFTLVPAIWLLIKPSSRPQQRQHRLDKLARFALRFGPYSAPALLLVGVLAMLQFDAISFNTDFVGFFKDQTPIQKAVQFTQQRFGGIGAIELVVEGPPGKLREPEVIRATLELEQQLRTFEDIDSALSAADLIQIAYERATNSPGAIPKTPEDVQSLEQVLLALANNAGHRALGRGQLQSFLNEEESKGRITIRVPSMGSRSLIALLDKIDRAAAKAYAFDPRIKASTTGTPAIFARSSEAMLQGQLRSFFWALIVISILMTLALRSLPLGLLSIIPNLFPIVTAFGAMALLGIPMNSFNAMVASVAIGIAVDDTIHILTGYRRFRQQHHAKDALHETLAHTGAAVLSTSMILACGFAVLCLGSFRPTAHFGFLTCISIVSALLADLFLLPPLVQILDRLRKQAEPGDQDKQDNTLSHPSSN